MSKSGVKEVKKNDHGLLEHSFQNKNDEEVQQIEPGMSTFQTRLSRESSRNNILESLNEFFVSSKSIKQNVPKGEIRRQRSQMLVDRSSHSLALKGSSSN